MNNEKLLAKYKALFPDNVEAIVVRKDDYDRLYGDLTIENIELKQEIERLQKLLDIEKNKREQFDKNNQLLHSIIKEVREYSNGIVKKYWSDDNRAIVAEKILEILGGENNDK